MALGHGHLCKALESGVKFIDTRATEIHSSVVQHLESAADYYLSAGFSSASEYSRAIGYLFDAYVYVDDAKKQNDTRRKSQLYAMAEKVLKASADAFERAAHPEKREQVLRLLDRVKEERELVLSLNEILVAPSIVSTTEAFLTPAPTYEEATGLDRFQHADIQAHLTAPNEVTVGDELNLQLDLVNVASNYGLLVRIQNLVPPGLMVTRLPPQYTMEKNGRKYIGACT